MYNNTITYFNTVQQNNNSKFIVVLNVLNIRKLNKDFFYNFMFILMFILLVLFDFFEIK